MITESMLCSWWSKQYNYSEGHFWRKCVQYQICTLLAVMLNVSMQTQARDQEQFKQFMDIQM